MMCSRVSSKKFPFLCLLFICQLQAMCMKWNVFIIRYIGSAKNKNWIEHREVSVMIWVPEHIFWLVGQSVHDGRNLSYVHHPSLLAARVREHQKECVMWWMKCWVALASNSDRSDSELVSMRAVEKNLSLCNNEMRKRNSIIFLICSQCRKIQINEHHITIVGFNICLGSFFGIIAKWAWIKS